MLPPPSAGWLVITRLGAAGIMLPLFVTIAIAFWRSGQTRALRTWAWALAAGVAVVLATKIAFIGWGWGSARFDFTGISGHATLAASIFPVWLGWLLARHGRRCSAYGAALGLGVAAVVGWSRLVLGAHSPSEVILGWLLGAGISLVACRSLGIRAPSMSWAGPLAGMLLLSAFSPGIAGFLPTHTWEVRVALALSGHARPCTRQDLHRQPKPNLAQSS